MVLAPLEAVTAPRSVQPSSYVDEDTTQVGGGKGLTVSLCKRAHAGERVAGQLSPQHTFGTRIQHLAHQQNNRCAFALPRGPLL